MSARYAQITATDGLPGAKPVTEFVAITSETEEFIVCWIVGLDGERKEFRTPEGLAERQWLIQRATISKLVPMEMDRTYCELRPVA